MRTSYLYAEIWPNGRAYIGQTTIPQHRHRQHIGSIARGAISIEREIATQNGILPRMVILAIFDLDIKYSCGTYEQIVTLTAEKAGFDLIFKDMGWPLDFEALRKTGRTKTPAQQSARKINLELGRRLMTSKRAKKLRGMNTPAQQEGCKRGGSANTPAQQKARSKNGRKIGIKYGAMNGIKSRAKLTADQVREIRERLNSGETGIGLAREFPISSRSISSIKLRRSYVWVK